MDIESFYPSKERFSFAMQINNLLASPGFEAWMEGEPLDITQLLYTAQGKPRVAIFSICAFNDAERMFFVSLLLNQLLGWVRTSRGPPACARCSTWTRSSGIFRRSRIRPRRRRC
jgi:hypothetical protein